jgi:flagellar basal body P-ring formation protein FlgA
VGCAALGWRLYVPVRVKRLLPVVVLARPVAQGQALSVDDVRLEMREQGSLAQAGFAALDAVEGLQARRALSAGNVLAARDVMTPRLIKRGDPVVLVLQRDGIEVRMSGRALADGGLGDRIGVENTASRRALQGEVRANGEVGVR